MRMNNRTGEIVAQFFRIVVFLASSLLLGEGFLAFTLNYISCDPYWMTEADNLDPLRDTYAYDNAGNKFRQIISPVVQSSAKQVNLSSSLELSQNSYWRATTPVPRGE